jgi:hypothetical protein
VRRDVVRMGKPAELSSNALRLSGWAYGRILLANLFHHRQSREFRRGCSQHLGLQRGMSEAKDRRFGVRQQYPRVFGTENDSFLMGTGKSAGLKRCDARVSTTDS